MCRELFFSSVQQNLFVHASIHIGFCVFFSTMNSNSLIFTEQIHVVKYIYACMYGFDIYMVFYVANIHLDLEGFMLLKNKLPDSLTKQFSAVKCLCTNNG